MKNILGAISFLTRIPVRSAVNPSDTVKHFPIVGYMAGGLYLLVFWIFGRSVPIVIFAIFITYVFFNAFHFDGLLDTSDSFMSQKGKERKLEIMKMGNSGPMAVFVGVLYMILLFYLMTKVSLIDILISTVGGRYGMVLMAYLSKPARSGLGASIFPVKLKSVLYASIYLIPFIFFPATLLLLLFGLASGFILKVISDHMIDGVTGDVLGAIEEVIQITILFAGNLI